MTPTRAEELWANVHPEIYRLLVYEWHAGRNTDVGRAIDKGTHWTVKDGVPDREKILKKYSS